MLILIILLVLLFGGGGYGYRRYGPRGGLSLPSESTTYCRSARRSAGLKKRALHNNL